MEWRDAVRKAAGAAGSADIHAVAHGQWTDAWQLHDGTRRRFVKTAHARYGPLLDAEAQGLAALRATGAVRVPEVIAAGDGWLLLEWLDLRPLDGRAAGRLGAALAALHLASAGERHGWAHDNFIGGTPQRNGWRARWVDFWRDCRLVPQLELAVRNGHDALQRDGTRLLSGLDGLLGGHQPKPALLHGDLWSGNAGALPDGTPVIFDPAVYIGDREADVAMTALFGGFGHEFDAAYRTTWVIDEGFEIRRDLYNLYHLLNHLNLFGRAYLGRCRDILRRLTSR
jgi:fructosamine-3-kinase